MIGDGWTYDPENPRDKPYMLWDPDARKAIPIGLRAWIEDELGATYGSHDVIAPEPLELVDKGTFGADDAGTALVKMQVKADATFVEGTKYPFTVRVNGADSFTRDDQTFYLLIKSQ